MPLLKSKKRKADEAELARLKKEGEGKYKTTARRVSDPRGGDRKKLKRGSSVIFSKKTTTSHGSGGERSTTQGLVPSRTGSIERFEAQDRNPNVANKRVTDTKLGRKLKENTGKTAKRENLQLAAATGGDVKKAGGYPIITKDNKKLLAYDYGKRKGELAGEYKKTEFKVPETKHTLTTPAAEPTTREKRSIKVSTPKRRGVTLAVRREAGDDPKNRGQNYKTLSMTIRKKKKPDTVVNLAKWKTKTKRSKSVKGSV